MKVKIFKGDLATEENPSGKCIVDLDTPEGVAIFGGEDAANKYKKERKIQEQIIETARTAAIKKLEELN